MIIERLKFPEDIPISDSLRDLLTKILTKDPKARIGMKEIEVCNKTTTTATIIIIIITKYYIYIFIIYNLIISITLYLIF